MMGNSFQPHIQRLAQAGLVTHIVKNAEAVDPLFALSKVQDFPQVTFAAVFSDGAVVFGCDDEVPPEIAPLAQSLEITDTSSDDLLASRIEELIAIVRQQSQNQPSDPGAEIAALRAALAEQSDHSGAILERLNQVETKMSAYQETVSAHLPEHAEQLSHIRAHLADDRALVDMLEAISALQIKDDPDDTIDLAAMLKGVGDSITERLHQIQSSQAIESHIAQVTAAIDQMRTGIVADMREMLPQEKPEGPPPVTQAEVAEMFSGLARADDLNESLTGLSAEIMRLHEKAAPESDRQDDLVAEQLKHMAEQIGAIAKRPDPKIDLTEQRQMMARFQTAMGQVLSRLEKEITRLAETHQKELGDSTTDTHLGDLVQSLTGQLAPLAVLPGKLDGIDAQLQKLPENHQTLTTTLTALSERPDPVIDLTEQRKSLAQFAGAIGTAIKRLETVTDQLAADDDNQDIVSAIERIEHHMQSHAADAAQPQHDDVFERFSDAISAVHNDISALLNRPPVLPDLSLQRTSFARFSTSLGTVLARFERIAEQLETGAVDAPGHEDQVDVQVAEPEAPARPFADTQVSLDDLRMSFAELIAQQIMNKSADDRTPQHCKHEQDT